MLGLTPTALHTSQNKTNSLFQHYSIPAWLLLKFLVFHGSIARLTGLKAYRGHGLTPQTSFTQTEPILQRSSDSPSASSQHMWVSPLLAESDLEMELEQDQDLLFGQEQYPVETVRKVSAVLYLDNVAEKPHQVASKTSDSRKVSNNLR